MIEDILIFIFGGLVGYAVGLWRNIGILNTEIADLDAQVDSLAQTMREMRMRDEV